MTDTLELGQTPVDGLKPAGDDLRLWSVTTIIGALDKPALVYWSAEQTALAAVHQQGAWQGLAEANPDEAVEWLKNARFKRQPGQRSAAELGTAVHDAAAPTAPPAVPPAAAAGVPPCPHRRARRRARRARAAGDRDPRKDRRRWNARLAKPAKKNV